MNGDEDAGSDRSDDVEQPSFENYLPGMPRLSTEPGRVERFLTNLFRQRGRYVAVVSRRAR